MGGAIALATAVNVRGLSATVPFYGLPGDLDWSKVDAPIQAHFAQARMLVIATPHTLEVRQMVETARTLNPAVQVVVRSHSEVEAALLERDHAGRVFVGESELARAMTDYVVGRVGGAEAAPSVRAAGTAAASG
jgi:dienelactone hydrolase